MKKKTSVSEIDEIVIYKQSLLKQLLTGCVNCTSAFDPNNPKQMHKLNEKIRNRHHIIFVKSVENNGNH